MTRAIIDVPEVRPALPADTEVLADIWHNAWHEAHENLVPASLVAMRSVNAFRDRLEGMIPRTSVLDLDLGTVGFCTVDGAELEQIFVRQTARGTGVARKLLKDGETRIRANGFAQAHLYCLPANRRAVRFYERTGWLRDGLTVERFRTAQGVVAVRSLKYTKVFE